MIKVEHLTKCYGDLMAVKDLSFEIGEGHVYGFLGPNGAGKSTTMNIMTGCLSATDGSIMIDEHDIYEEPEAAKRLIGYLPEQPPLYVNETPLEYLQFVGEAKGLKGAELKAQIASVMEQTGIAGVRNRLISSLSKGYKQRVGIAQALLGNPKVIILDEPTVGLDPIQIIEIRQLIRQLGENHTVIFSSHILSEVQSVCEKVLIISKGQLVAFDTPENLEGLLAGSAEISCSLTASEEQVTSVLNELQAISQWNCTEHEDGSVTVQISAECENIRSLCSSLVKAFVLRGLSLYEISSRKVSLEDVFIELTQSIPDQKADEDDSGQSSVVSEMEQNVSESGIDGNSINPDFVKGSKKVSVSETDLAEERRIDSSIKDAESEVAEK